MQTIVCYLASWVRWFDGMRFLYNSKFNIKTWTWTLNRDNIASPNFAEVNVAYKNTVIVNGFQNQYMVVRYYIGRYPN